MGSCCYCWNVQTSRPCQHCASIPSSITCRYNPKGRLPLPFSSLVCALICHAVVMCLTRGSDGACVVTVCQCCVGTSFVYGASTYADLLCSCWLCIHRRITSSKHTHTKAKSVQLSLSSSKYVCFVQLHANRHSGIRLYASIHTYIRIKMSDEHCMPLSQWQYS